jgi:hypothetical protein
MDLALMQIVCWLIKKGKKGKYNIMFVTEEGFEGN